MILQSEQQGVRCRAYLLSPYLQARTPTKKTTTVLTYLRSTTWQDHSLELITPMTAVVLLRHRPIALTCSAAARMTNSWTLSQLKAAATLPLLREQFRVIGECCSLTAKLAR